MDVPFDNAQDRGESVHDGGHWHVNFGIFVTGSSLRVKTARQLSFGHFVVAQRSLKVGVCEGSVKRV
jgi:hypothetical protein